MPTDVIYIKCCVLASQIPDTTNDVLQRSDIKKIFANTKNINFDIEHQRKYLSGIEIVENYINQSEEHIKGTKIPPGSWIMVLAIYNNQLQNSIHENKIKGVSLRTALGEAVNLTDNTLTGRIEYKDILNKEEMQPESISFTSDPANEIPIEIMTYEAYTAKNKNRRTGDKMINEDSENSFWRRLFKENFTAKNTANPTPQPTSELLGSVDAEEFMNSMIESQKAISKQTELIQKLVESQTKSADAINNLKIELEQFKLNLSDMKLATTNTEETTEPEEQDTENQEENTEEIETKPQDAKEKQNTDKEQDEDKEKEKPEEKHTAKSRKPVRRLVQTNQEQEEILKFIANRSYENFMKN